MFNLVNDPWIPVNIKGKQESVSLSELFCRADEISGISGNSLEKISVIRLILAITQASLNIKTEKDWKKCRKSIVNSTLKYLNKWSGSFNLYGKRAFLQIPWISAKPSKPIEELFIQKASGDNHTLFDHGARGPQRNYSNPEIALALLVSQQFKPGGLIQAKAYKWHGKKVSPVGSARASILNNLLVTVLQGDNLLDTIHYNLIPEEWLKEAKINLGTPIWEYGEFKRNDKNIKSICRSYLTNLVPITRGIVLYEDSPQITLVDGFQAPSYPLYRDPMVAQKEKPTKNGSPFIGAFIDKSIWREIEGILRVSEKIDETQGAWALRHKFSKQNMVTITVGALSCNKAKINGILEWNVRVSGEVLRRFDQYIVFIREAERVFKALRSAIGVCLSIERDRSKRDGDFLKDSMEKLAFSEYWNKMENLADKVFHSKEIDWLKEIRCLAYRTYEKVCPQINIESITRGELYLQKELYQ